MAKTRSKKTVSGLPPRAAETPGDPNAWKLQIRVEEDEELSARRFTVWIAPAGDSGLHLCIGSGPTRAAAVEDAEIELRGAVTLLGKEAGFRCPKCGFVRDPVA